MKKILLTGFFLMIPFFYTIAQTGKVVLIEGFSETGCGACAQYDSSFQALINANSEKVVLINYHCHYSLDTFYTYYKACNERYGYYTNMSGFPSAMANGKEPIKKSSHLSYINQTLINKLYDEEPHFKFDISCKSAGKGNSHKTNIQIKATALKEYPGKYLRLYIAITENNIDHEKRYKKKSVNGINIFNHILRALIPTVDGILIGPQKVGKVNKIKASFVNDDKEIDFKEVRIVAYVQDLITKEVFGAAVTKEHPFK